MAAPGGPNGRRISMQPFGLTFARALGTAALGLGLALPLAFAPGLAQAQPAPATASNTFDAVKARGQLVCGVNTGLAGFAQPDSQGVWRGFDADYCRADRRGHLRRCQQGALRADHGAGALHRAAVGRGRRAVAQHHLDAVARHLARARLRRDQLLRRPGLHGEGQPRREVGQGAGRRHHLRAARHHDRAEPRPTVRAPTRSSSPRW